MPPRKPANVESIVSRRVAVLVKHRLDINTRTPKVIWLHEKPILELIHGEGNVEEIPNEKLNEHFRAKATADLLPWNKAQDAFMPPSDALGIGFAFTGDPQAEYERLGAVYGKMADRDQLVVEAAYGRFSEGRFERLVQSGENEDMPDAQLRQMIRGHGYVPIVDKDSSPEARADALERHKTLTTAPREKLLELAAEIEAAYA